MTDGSPPVEVRDFGSGELTARYTVASRDPRRPRVVIEYVVLVGRGMRRRKVRRRLRVSSLSWWPISGWMTLGGQRVNMTTGEDVVGQFVALSGAELHHVETIDEG